MEERAVQKSRGQECGQKVERRVDSRRTVAKTGPNRRVHLPQQSAISPPPSPLPLPSPSLPCSSLGVSPVPRRRGWQGRKEASKQASKQEGWRRRNTSGLHPHHRTPSPSRGRARGRKLDSGGDSVVAALNGVSAAPPVIFREGQSRVCFLLDP